jgi:tight adherence protein C
MTLSLIVLIGLIVTASTAAVWAVLADRSRREVLSRADGRIATVQPVVVIAPPEGTTLSERIGEWLRRHLPATLGAEGKAADKLVQAGYDGPAAPVIYGILRLGFAVLPPLAALAVAPGMKPAMFIVVFALAVAIGLLGPPATLDRLVAIRQQRIQRALPDSLDLLVVCVEAGVSLDSAILRVAKDMENLHPDLSHELLVVNRRVNAGLSREQALHGLWQRTGVEELRALASSMIQSERWGTSIATVLRVYAETMRRRRKQHAEKRAAEAPVKMLFPLVLFIFPTLFVAILGPAMIRIREAFSITPPSP